METKQTIWVFGDSYSTPFKNHYTAKWANEYIRWKGYPPLHFGDILATELDCNVKYFSEGGLCNDGIFEHIYTQAPNIQKGDVIIIGWSSIHRFRLATLDNKWWNIIPNFNNFGIDYPPISQRTLDEVLVNRDLKLYHSELKKRRGFIQWLFKKNILIQWSPFNDVCVYNVPLKTGLPKPTTIFDETKGEIEDYHYSEQGHIELADGFLRLINSPTLLETFSTLDKPLI